jgi:hypothetical protein
MAEDKSSPEETKRRRTAFFTFSQLPEDPRSPKDPERRGDDFILWRLYEEPGRQGEPGRKQKTYVRVDVEDIIAIGAVLVAFMFAVAMIFGAVPINRLTVAVVGLSGCGVIVARIVRARRGKETRSPWLERAVWSLTILILVTAFGFYVWLNR